jgi:2-amino-4-hydroxy-6-hydroxymethyldihydropteridine diphosphokinase
VTTLERVLLGIGGNIGDRVAELRAGVDAMATHQDITVNAVSSLWETEYVGEGEQDPYLNGCVDISTTLEPVDLLAALKAIEHQRGRSLDGHLKPRPLDLDILLFGQRVIAAKGLSIPHPDLALRAFVLEPLAELAADLVLPDSGETVQEIRAKMRDADGPWIHSWDGAGLMDDITEE